MAKKQGLGRGLKSLITEDFSLQEKMPEGGKDNNPIIFELDIQKIRPNKEQPRKQFDQEALEELAASIKEHGILQPLAVRPENDGYTIVAGERRFRAAGLAGLKTVPVIIRDLDPKAVLEIAIIENVQREDLNPLEEAMAYDKLMKEFGLNQTEVAKRIGKNRSSVNNTLRMLKLPEPVRQMLLEDKITLGHAKALLGLDDEDKIIKLAKEITAHQLSVREVEKLVKGEKIVKTKKKVKDIPLEKDLYLTDCETQLREHFTAGVTIKGTSGKGSIIIPYHSESEFNRIFELINMKGEKYEAGKLSY